MKTLKLEDLDLTPEDKAVLVEGAQRFLPPVDEQGEPIPTVDKKPE